MKFNKKLQQLEKETCAKLEELTMEEAFKIRENFLTEQHNFFKEIDGLIEDLYKETSMAWSDFYPKAMAIATVLQQYSEVYKEEMISTFLGGLKSHKEAKALDHVYEDFLDNMARLWIPQNQAMIALKRVNYSHIQRATTLMNEMAGELVEHHNKRMMHYIDMLENYEESHTFFNEDEEEREDFRQCLQKFTKVKDLEELAKANGFEKVRQKGSHQVYANKEGDITVIPKHNKDIDRGLAYQIQKQILKN